MKCAWDKYLNLFPVQLRNMVNEYENSMVFETRLRLDKRAEIVTLNGSVWLDYIVKRDDLNYCVNIASRYSPWSAATVSDGYITAQGGHRIGICGQAIMSKDTVHGIRYVTSVCIRTARDIDGIAKTAAVLKGSILILGRPGSGKTTLLRDLIRQLSQFWNIAVIDEREELFPVCDGASCFSTGKKTDVLHGCRKPIGIEMALRTMNPDYIALDEITAPEDCEGLLRAGWCGVKLIATAHAQSKADLMKRPVYKPVVDSGLFDHLIILQPSKSWHVERMNVCC